MYDAFSRMEILMGTRAVNRLGSAKIAVFGIGGAGSYVVEALARCGVGSLTLVDHKDIVQSDINRQLYAGQSTVGRKKVQTAKEHIRDIDENILVHTYETYYNEETAGMFDLQSFDYIVDAMDVSASKVLLIERAGNCQVPVISCLATDNKINPARLEIADISRVISVRLRCCVPEKRHTGSGASEGRKKTMSIYSREVFLLFRVWRAC